MKLFKNRGDIYISKVNKEKSIEQRILLTALVFIVLFTIVFVIGLGIKYDFSAKKFFAPDEPITTVTTDVNDEVLLPEVSGKTNFFLTVQKDGKLLFAALVQADLDNIAYKATVLKPETLIGDAALSDIYGESEHAALAETVKNELGIPIDYFADMQSKDFEELYNSAGVVSFPVLNDIHFKDNDSAVPYSVRLRAGEQKIKGADFVNLTRYYLSEDMTSSAGELFLAGLSQHFNQEFYENKEELFTEFVTKADTNISIKDFSLADPAFEVLTNEKVGVGVYNAFAEYDGNEITAESLRSVKSYYVK